MDKDIPCGSPHDRFGPLHGSASSEITDALCLPCSSDPLLTGAVTLDVLLQPLEEVCRLEFCIKPSEHARHVIGEPNAPWYSFGPVLETTKSLRLTNLAVGIVWSPELVGIFT